MIHRYGIDTSILVRLTSGDPPAGFQRCVERLSHILASGNAEIFASNQVIGESYVALQHHYGVSKWEARQALREALSSGLVAPQQGKTVLDMLLEQGTCESSFSEVVGRRSETRPGNSNRAHTHRPR